MFIDKIIEAVDKAYDAKDDMIYKMLCLAEKAEPTVENALWKVMEVKYRYF